MAQLLIVDDEQSICWGLSKLVQEMGHSVATAASAEQALEAVKQKSPDAIVLDVRLPGMDGLEAMKRFREELGPVPIIVITAYGALPTAVRAVRNGASDYLTKPFDLEVAQRAIERALEKPAARNEEASSPLPLGEDQIVGESPPMQEVFKRIALVAASDACVHLRGASGTGKELAARAIHRYSSRAAGPFVAINVASLSPTVAESELFGHTRGAFTGADEARKGLLQQADGGTIFLDEVADIPMPIQVKLLRSLEHGEVLPVGATESIRSDFRIISATHQSLPDRVSQGDFRHDLYFRLVTFEIELPPLCERREDIPLLIEHFLMLLAANGGQTVPTISEAARQRLLESPWHGNVRELRNAIEHATVLARGGAITEEHLPAPVPESLVAGSAKKDSLEQLVRQWTEERLLDPEQPDDLYECLLRLVEPPFLRAVMRQCNGQCATAARKLGLHRTTLRKKLDQFKIEDE